MGSVAYMRAADTPGDSAELSTIAVVMGSWTVIEHTDDWIALSRSGEFLELHCPDASTIRLIFTQIWVGQLIDGGMLRASDG
jgi:hypothetical protein